MRPSIPLLAAALLTACTSTDTPAPAPVAVAVNVDSLLAPAFTDSVRTKLDADLRAAESVLAAMPDDPDALIWVGRRQGYLADYRGAVATLTRGVERFPDDPRFYRHRGHRYITLRDPARAIDDFTIAARLTAGQDDEVEPDGQPNARGIPTSTLQFNIWYHLGLAHHLRGEWNEAAYAYERCLAVSKNPDAVAATAYWMYLTLRRAGDRARADLVAARITPDLEVIENTAYLKLMRYFQGVIPRDSVAPAAGDAVGDATVAYGLALFDLIEGRDTTAAPFQRILDGAGSRAAFGYIAAEAEVARRVR
jgi:tetratricopeptide (TPR) repeat protein